MQSLPVHTAFTARLSLYTYIYTCIYLHWSYLCAMPEEPLGALCPAIHAGHMQGCQQALPSHTARQERHISPSQPSHMTEADMKEGVYVFLHVGARRSPT